MAYGEKRRGKTKGVQTATPVDTAGLGGKIERDQTGGF